MYPASFGGYSKKTRDSAININIQVAMSQHTFANFTEFVTVVDYFFFLSANKVIESQCDF